MAQDLWRGEPATRTRSGDAKVIPIDGVGTRDGAFVSAVTLADVLQLPAVAAGMPHVVHGHQWLSRMVAGMRVVDHVDTQQQLAGGELLLISGVALRRGPDEIRRYIAQLAEQGAAGVMIGLGRLITQVPDAMAATCAQHRLPVIALQGVVSLDQVAWAVESTLGRARQALLETTATAHQRFTDLTLDGASISDLVAATADLAGGQVVFATVLHKVVALDSRGGSPGDVMERWRRVRMGRGALSVTTVDDQAGVVVTRVEVRRQLRGRLALFVPRAPDPAQIAVLERGAAAIAMLLHQASDDMIWASARRTLLTDLLTGGYASAEAALARASAMGHTIHGSAMVVMVIRSDDAGIGELVQQAFSSARVDAISGPAAPGCWAALVMVPESNEDVTDLVAGELGVLAAAAGSSVTVARGGTVDEPSGIRRSYEEAIEVVAAAHEAGPVLAPRPCYTIADVGLRGLLVALRDDPRVEGFAERMLQPLLERDRREDGDWVRTLAVYLSSGRNKSSAAIELGISRQTLYQRLARVRRMLDVDLDDVETLTSLHVAVMTIGAARPDGRKILQPQEKPRHRE
jgi:purine catabolism regulator